MESKWKFGSINYCIRKNEFKSMPFSIRKGYIKKNEVINSK